MNTEDKTRIIRRPGQAEPGQLPDEDEKTRIVHRDDAAGGEFPEDMDETRKLDVTRQVFDAGHGHIPPVVPDTRLETDPEPMIAGAIPVEPHPPGGGGIGAFVEDDDKTVIYRPSKKPTPIADDAATGPAGDISPDSSKDSDDPVVGWLVIVEGAGRGFAFELGYGINRIGRGDDQRVSINFGDVEISRDNHLSIAYDHKGRKFFAQSGGSNQLAYLGDTPLLQPVELNTGDILTIGQTKLAFVPFCNGSFDWKAE